MTLSDQPSTDHSLLVCPNCGAAGSLRPIVVRGDPRKHITDIEFKCTACDVLIVHTIVPPPAE